MTRWWEGLRVSSFQKVSRNKNLKFGICEEVKELMDKERWVKEHVLENPERGRQLAEIRKSITTRICLNQAKEMEELVNID